MSTTTKTAAISILATAVAIVGGGMGVWSFIEKRIENRTRSEMRLQAVEQITKTLDGRLWTFEQSTLPMIRAEIDALEEEIEADRLARAKAEQ